ncbi:hypothetical protein P8452_30192 [Trifolium repens]|nr:hypothetical protein P8452_30192 [Trifolium repens]
MAQIHKIFYSLIIFLTLSGFVTNGTLTIVPCEDWRDCPTKFCRYPKRKICVQGFCDCSVPRFAEFE